MIQFQFTCPSRSTTIGFAQQFGVHIVSIHVPLAEHDLQTSRDVVEDYIVSIHVPLAEHDR